MSLTISPLPDDSASPTGRAQHGQRDVGDLFSPFFRVSFKNISKAEADANTNETDGADQLIADRFASSDEFRTDGTALLPPEENAETFNLDSRLLPKTAASLKIESKSSAALRFTLTLTPPYEDGIRILNSRLINFGTLVKVQWGYAGWGAGANILSDIFVFRNNFPQAEFGEDIKIVISGDDLTASVGTRNAATRKWLFSEYPNDCAIVRQIVARTKVKLDTSAVPAESSFLTGANRPKPETGGATPDAAIEQTVNDWSFIRRLCHDHSLSFTSQGVDFKIFSLFDASTAQNYSYRLLYRRKPETKRDIPVSNIRANLMPWTFLPAEGRGLVQFTFNDNNPSASQIKKESPASGTKPGLAPGGATGDAAGKPNNVVSLGGDGDGEQVNDEQVGSFTVRPRPNKFEDKPPLLSVPSGAHNAEEKLENEINKIRAFSHPMVGVAAPGVVDLWPGITVMLEGTSDLFDGPYFVRDATHTISSSGYDMDLTLLRHTIKGGLGEKPVANPVTPTSEGDKDEVESAVEEDGRADLLDFIDTLPGLR